MITIPKWFLILTLVNGYDGRISTTMTTAGPFESQKVCVAASNAWLQQVQEMRRPHYNMDAQTLCVPASSVTCLNNVCSSKLPSAISHGISVE